MAEGAAVMLFYQVGELFQSYAVGKSRKSIADMMDIAPDYANVMRDGELGARWTLYEVAVGDEIVVKPGERIPHRWRDYAKVRPSWTPRPSPAKSVPRRRRRRRRGNSPAA